MSYRLILVALTFVALTGLCCASAIQLLEDCNVKENSYGKPCERPGEFAGFCTGMNSNDDDLFCEKIENICNSTNYRDMFDDDEVYGSPQLQMSIEQKPVNCSGVNADPDGCISSDGVHKECIPLIHADDLLYGGPWEVCCYLETEE